MNWRRDSSLLFAGDKVRLGVGVRETDLQSVVFFWRATMMKCKTVIRIGLPCSSWGSQQKNIQKHLYIYS